VTGRDWVGWHASYDDPNSSLHRRLLLVRQRIREFLNAAPPGPVRVLSMCAGQGRDLLGVLPHHPRGPEVRAVLVELDPRNADAARERASAAGLGGITVHTADAGRTTPYRDVVPVHLALVCGVFGNVSDADIRHTVAQLPTLCTEGATVIWTRHREPPDLTPTIRTWFAANGFTEVAFDAGEDSSIGVGTHRMTGPARPYQPDVRLFEFVQRT
jgi:Putative methyltransferase